MGVPMFFRPSLGPGAHSNRSQRLRESFDLESSCSTRNIPLQWVGKKEEPCSMLWSLLWVEVPCSFSTVT